MKLAPRVVGVETEYGMHVFNRDKSHSETASAIVRSYHGEKKAHWNLGPTNRSIVRDYDYARPWDGEGDYVSYAHSGTGSIIENGGRFYVDMSHPEYCTPEVTNARDAVIWDKAGERIVHTAAQNIFGTKIFKNNSDGKGNSYGTHENYLIKRYSETDFKEILARGLIPFFVTRQLFTGSGKLGVESPEPEYLYQYASKWKENMGEGQEPFWTNFERQAGKLRSALRDIEASFLDLPEFTEMEKQMNTLITKRKTVGVPVVYQMSQRADFIEQIMGLQTTFDRPLINTRDEPHVNHHKYMRLHVICGDANMCETAMYLKIGVTSLVLDLIEDGLHPVITLADPVQQTKALSRDQTRKWLVALEDGSTISAVDLQRLYLKKAQDSYRQRNEIIDDILSRWEKTLDALEMIEKKPLELFGEVDWVTKLYVLNAVAERHDLPMTDSLVAEYDLNYHNIDPRESVFYKLQHAGKIKRIVTDEEIRKAVSQPPLDTRAFLRSRIIHRADVCNVDWGGFSISVGGKKVKVTMTESLRGTLADLGSLVEGDEQSAEDFLMKLKGIEGIIIE